MRRQQISSLPDGDYDDHRCGGIVINLLISGVQNEPNALISFSPLLWRNYSCWKRQLSPTTDGSDSLDVLVWCIDVSPRLIITADCGSARVINGDGAVRESIRTGLILFREIGMFWSHRKHQGWMNRITWQDVAHPCQASHLHESIVAN